MGDFSAGWLAVREAADRRARSESLARASLAAAAGDDRRLVNGIDLGGGTGANVRYFLELSTAAPQRWQILDRDPALLAEVPRCLERWAQAQGGTTRVRGRGAVVDRPGMPPVEVTTREVELTPLAGAELFAGAALVTASALLDLVSEGWLQTLAAQCRQAGATVLFALTYDGRIDCTPREEGDVEVSTLVNRHQRSDKGFGPALGPGAADTAVRAFTAVGYQVQRVRSDWHLTSSGHVMQAQLIDGWANAAAQVNPSSAGDISAWRVRRQAHVSSGRSNITVGHEDMAGTLPAGTR